MPEPLGLVAFAGNLDMLKSLIEERSYDVRLRDTDGKTLLRLACAGGNLDVVKYLIGEHQLDPKSKDDDDSTPLHSACEKGHLHIVRYLVNEQSVDPKSASDDRHIPPLHVACGYGHLEVVRFLIEEKGCDHTQLYQPKDGLPRSPLHSACESGNVDLVRYLVDEQSVDPDNAGSSLTPLHVACGTGQLEVAKFLIEEKKCNLTQTFQSEKTGQVWNVLHMASGHGHVDIARYLIEEKQFAPMSKMADTDLTPLSLACRHGHLDVVKYLVNEKSIDPVYELNNGNTPFHVACEKGQLEIVKFLVEEKGYNPMYDHEKYPTPFGIACAGGHLDVVRYLTEERQCDPLAKDVNGYSAILGAAVSNNIQILKYFVEERGCDLKASGDYGNALYLAIRGDNLQGLQYLSTGRSSAHQGKDQDASPVPQQKRYPQETHSSQSSSDKQSLPPDEPPLLKRERMKTENEAPPPNVPLREPPHQLNPDDLAFLTNHLQPMASQWRPFGLQLGLLSGDLDTIAATPLLIPGGPAAYLEEVLKRWMNRAPPSPTLSKLCDSLRSCAVDQSRIALELEQQYQTWKTGQRWDEDHELKSLVKEAEPTGRQLGAGAYGSVEQVKVEGTTYAAKRFRLEICKSPNESREKFFAELRILCSIRHPNIVQYHCVCYLPNSESPALVMEQLQTNLHDYLLNPSYANLPLNAKVSILQDIARGLAHLHNHKPAVIHRDLTARNVLLNSDRVAKISDFGNSRIIDIDPACSTHFQSTTHVPGTIIYMPPEACSDHARFNEKLDIFSFGHLALFTATQVFPCDLLPATFCDDDGKLCARTEVERRQKYIGQLEQQLGGDHDLIKLIKQCLRNSPKMRPTADDIIRHVEQLVVATHTCLVQ